MQVCDAKALTPYENETDDLIWQGNFLNFGKTRILSFDCCTLKQYLDKVNDLNFASAFFQKYE